MGLLTASMGAMGKGGRRPSGKEGTQTWCLLKPDPPAAASEADAMPASYGDAGRGSVPLLLLLPMLHAAVVSAAVGLSDEGVGLPFLLLLDVHPTGDVTSWCTCIQTMA